MAVGALFVSGALYFVLVEIHRPGQPAQDVYAYFVPNAVHAARSFWDGGRGLLWNPYQACGQPFLANTEVGMFYPPHLLFLVLAPDTALHLVLIFNMVAGACGMYLLARELGVGAAAAVAGALVFELGDPMAQLIAWSPMHSAPWTWVPWALLFCERLLRRPGLRDFVALAGVLAVQLVSGFVLQAVFTYQLLAGRALWEMLTRRDARALRAGSTVMAGLACGALLVAVHLIPAAELAAQSARVTGAVWARPMSPAVIADRVGRRLPPFPFMAAPLALTLPALLSANTRRISIFYAVTGVGAAALALGPATPLFPLYAQLPFISATVRNHVRLFWVTGLCLAVLTALGLERVRHGRARSTAVVLLAAAAALWALTPGGLRRPEWLALGVIVAGGWALLHRGVPRPAVAWTMVAALGVNLVLVPLRWSGSLSWSSPLADYSPTFAKALPPLSADDRIMLEPGVAEVVRAAFAQKLSTMLRVKGYFDYEPLLSERYERYTLRLQSSGARNPFVDLAALRVVVASPGAPLAAALGLQRLAKPHPRLEVFLNPSAFARARYVPRVEVVPDSQALADRIGAKRDDFATMALIEEPPPSGFTGEVAAASGVRARFIVDDPERIVIDVDAPQRGFLVLADQYFPGWRATVNGEPATILRANYLFRAVEVPAGRVRAEFRYRPASLMAGAAVSALTAIFLGLLWRRARGGGAADRSR